MRLAKSFLSFLSGGLPVLVVALAFAGPAQAQPSNTCDGSESLDGMDTLPQMLNLAAGSMTDSFTLTGGGCTDVVGDDMVVCFTPTSSCMVDISCFYTPVGNGTTTANLFQGPCNTSPASCIASVTAPTAITAASLNGGTEYCVVCSNSISATSLDVMITVNSGDCGALPVDLQHFSVAARASTDAADAEVSAQIP